ncbi:hypothetical protein [Candidatus Nitrotoga sp. HW29]|uniref:hypothetical protein n=1 Tax=Candidatus Nitrotoga sp. HW29 TaxID=2886963 RepID=UPI001EF34140|nr:hypothetical protein [Candidatus Nitrotoga sp. HW29]
MPCAVDGVGAVARHAGIPGCAAGIPKPARGRPDAGHTGMQHWDASEQRSNLPWRKLLSDRRKSIATGDMADKTTSVFDRYESIKFSIDENKGESHPRPALASVLPWPQTSVQSCSSR